MQTRYQKMNNRNNIIRILSLTLLILHCGLSLASEKSNSVESVTWRFEFVNDNVFNKDNKISSGWSLQKHSAVAKSWEELDEVPEFVRHWGRVIPSLTKEGLVYRAGIAIGQVIQTPDDLSSSTLIKDDVPYAGVMALQASWYAYNDNEFRGFEIIAGVLGPPSLAEQFQKISHKLIDSEEPMGWDNQLKTEALINVNYMRKKKLFHRGNPAALAFDTAVNGNIGLGNLFTQASAALEMRFGYNMPQGFLYVPDPIGLSMHYNASLKPANPQLSSFYGSLVLRGSAYAHNIFLDGNTFHDSHSVDKETLVGMLIAGIHFEQRNWGMHFNVIVSSDDVDTSKLPSAEGKELLATLDIEWRF